MLTLSLSLFYVLLAIIGILIIYLFGSMFDYLLGDVHFDVGHIVKITRTESTTLTPNVAVYTATGVMTQTVTTTEYIHITVQTDSETYVVKVTDGPKYETYNDGDKVVVEYVTGKWSRDVTYRDVQLYKEGSDI